MRKYDIQKKIWLDYDSKKKLKDNAEKTGLTESSYIRCLINNYKPKDQPTQETYEKLDRFMIDFEKEFLDMN